MEMVPYLNYTFTKHQMIRTTFITRQININNDQNIITHRYKNNYVSIFNFNSKEKILIYFLRETSHPP